MQSAQFIFTSAPRVLSKGRSEGGLLQHVLEETSSIQSLYTNRPASPICSAPRDMSITQSWHQKELSDKQFPDQQ